MTIIFDGTQGITTPAETANNSVTTPVVKSSANLVFQSNGTTEAMRIDTSQRVGIGTNNPTHKFHVSVTDSVIRFTDTNGGEFFLGSDSTGTYLRTFTNDTFRILRASGTESMRLDGSGRVTMPSQPFFYARKSSTPQTSVNGTTATFDVTVTNIGSHYNTSTNRFTAPVSGVYSFTAKVWMSKNGGAYASFDPRINGTLIPASAGAYYDGAILTTGNANYIVNFQHFLNASDFVEFTYGCAGGGQTVTVDNSGYFCGFLLN